MTLTFAKTHNMIAYLSNSDESEGFNQIIDFLNGSSVKYALTVNSNIYVSCIKQFWTSVAVKKVNDVMRLQALVDKKKVIIIEASIRDTLRWMMLKLSKECGQFNQVLHVSTFLTTYDKSPSRVGKGCLGEETPLFERMIVAQEVADEGDVEVNVDDVPTFGVATEGDVSAADDDVPTVVEEPSIPSPTPPTPPPQPSQDQPSTSQDVELPMNLLQNLIDICTTLTRRAEHLEHNKVAQALEITKLKQRVKKLERRNKASKLKRLKKVGTAQRFDTSDDTVMNDVSKQGGIIANINADEDAVLKDAKDVGVKKSANVEESADIQGRKAESQAQIYQIDLEHANKLITEVVTAASATLTAATPQLTSTAAHTLTTAPSTARRRKEVVIRDPKESATPSIIVHSEAKSKDKGKGILVEEPKPLKKQAQIKQDEKYARELEAELNKNVDWDEVIDHVQRKQKEDNSVKRYQALKRKPQTEAQSRKNMMIYLRNVVAFKMDYFKGMTYDDIRPFFKKHFDLKVAFLQKTKEQMYEEDSRALKRLNESQEDKAAKKQKLDEEVEELKRHLQIVPNNEDDVYT
nr:hypothetical protein [Tanacetum cinerariifolium]